ncbi:MAG: EsaB/YukD family protein [Clostridium sp.]|nr:EsaB/YukD family protein [Clostridium sp.]MCM1499191.1 EsaB/YukD family protein [Clostridium sp.]
MSKRMVELYLPAAGASYDVRIPTDSRIGDMIPLLEACMAELEDGYFVPDADSILCDRETGVVLDVNLTAGEMGIVNGAKLMLI